MEKNYTRTGFYAASNGYSLPNFWGTEYQFQLQESRILDS